MTKRYIPGCGPQMWSCSDWERIFLSVISECKGVHRCQVLQLDGEEEEEEEGRRAELARAHGKNLICFHSSSNKQWGNFASAHLWLNTLTQRHSRPAISEQWVSCYELNICRNAQHKAWPSIYSSAALVLIWNSEQVCSKGRRGIFEIGWTCYIQSN